MTRMFKVKTDEIDVECYKALKDIHSKRELIMMGHFVQLSDGVIASNVDPLFFCFPGKIANETELRI